MNQISPSQPRTFPEAIASFFSITGILLLIVFGTGLFMDQYLTEKIQDEIMNPDGTSNWVWIYGGLSFTIGLLAPVLTSFLALCAWRFPEENVVTVAKRSFGFLVREEMRVLGKSLLWGLLFVLPGLIRFFQCAFVSYVVLLDDRYQRGEVDALQRSWVFVKKVWLKLAFLLFVFGIVIPLAMTSFDEWRSFFQHSATASLFMIVELTILLIFQWQVLKTWEKAHATDLPVV